MNSENDYNHIHLLNEIRRIELLLQLRVLQFRRELQDGHENDNYRGLYISDEEIDHILKKQTSDLPTPEHDNQQPAFNENSPEVQEIKYKIKKIEKSISSIISTAVSKGVLLRFQHFCNIFSLTPFEKDVILLCLAPEFDLKFEKLIAYLNDDVTRKRPTIDLTLKVLCLSRMERWNKRMAFSDSSPLYANALLSSHDPPPAPPGAVLARQLALEPNVIDHLLGGTDMDPHITPFTKRIVPALNGESLNLPARLAEKLSDISRTPCLFQDVSDNIPSDTPVFYFKGTSGNGQMEVLDALCAQFRRPILKVQLNRIAHSNISADALYKRISKDARLTAGFVLIEGLDNTWMEGQQNQNPFSSVLIRLLCTLPCPLFMTGVSDWSPPIGKRPFITIPFPAPDFTERKLLWKKCIADTTMNKDIDIEWIASQFRLSHTQIQQAWSSAINQVGCQSSKNQVVTTQDLNRACQIESMIDLSHSAQVISPRFSWDDIVLSKDSMEQLRDIYHHAKHRRKVYESWHFDKKSPYGNGLNILFSGTSGTGKTMAAEVIASSLELVMLKIDLSTMVSK
ncbi:MAG: AAA family ATPase [Desulfamplus sp.]|nr:AAA family ATPase [Desulfamplus sp.]